MRKAEGRVAGGEEVEVVLVVLVVLVEGDEMAAIVDVRGLTGVEINHRIKGKNVGVIVELVMGKPVFKEVKSWLNGCRRVEETTE